MLDLEYPDFDAKVICRISHAVCCSAALTLVKQSVSMLMVAALAAVLGVWLTGTQN